MINPGSRDIGKYVLYADVHRLSDGSCEVIRTQKGYITSYNDKFVFVRYDDGCTSQATNREDLYWLDKNGEVIGIFP